MNTISPVTGTRVKSVRRPGARRWVFALTLLSQLALAFGLPLPAPSPALSDAAPTYPCQHRPCGCGSAAECWQGDCCCFTLEEKLAWAEAHGVEPPGHVRPLVAARRAGAVERLELSCCSEAHADCPDCADRPALRWVIGLFAGKCRGETSARLTFAQPCPVPVSTPVALDESAGRERLCLRVPEMTSVPVSPSDPPPRSC